MWARETGERRGSGRARGSGELLKEQVQWAIVLRFMSHLMSLIEQSPPLERRWLFNSDGAKNDGKSLETQDHCALELFAPELIHESKNCPIVHILRPDSSKRETLLVEDDVE
jgi:hypothetical protein